MAENPQPRGFDVNQPGSGRETGIGLLQGATTDLVGGLVDFVPYLQYAASPILAQIMPDAADKIVEDYGSEALGKKFFPVPETSELQRIRDDARLVGASAGLGEAFAGRLAKGVTGGINDFLKFIEGDSVAATPEGVSLAVPPTNLPDTSVTNMAGNAGSATRINLPEDFNFYQDNPAVHSPDTGQDWLAGNIKYTEEKYSETDPAMLRGPITGVLGGGRRYGQKETKINSMYLPTAEIRNLPGANFETRGPGDPQFDQLFDRISKEGWDHNQANNKIVVGVNHMGQPYVLEGNTRAAVAAELGVPNVRVEIRYWNGGEMIDGPYAPAKVSARAATRPMAFRPAPVESSADPLTVRSLGGGKGGITGLAHGIKLYDRDQIITPNLEEAFFKTPGSGIMSLDIGDTTLVSPSERYSMDPALLEKHAGTTMSVADIVKEFGLSNRVRSILTDKRATSAEINRPGFSLSTNPVLSLTGFATSDVIGKPAKDRLEGLVAAAPAEKLYVKSGEFDVDGQPIYRPREMTENDVQNLSPSQYLLAAYDPDKPLLKKPNTKYNESEVHIAEDASHALNIRPLTAREGEDVVRQLDFEQVAKREAEKAVFNIESFVIDRTPTTTGPNLHDQNRLGTTEHRNIVDVSMKQLASAVQNPAAIGAFNLREIEGNAYYFAKALVEQSKQHKMRTIQDSQQAGFSRKVAYSPDDAELLVSMYPEPLNSPVSNGQRLYEAAVKFKHAKEIEVADYVTKKPLVEAGAKLQTELLRNALTGRSAKYSKYFMYQPDSSKDLAKLRPANLYEIIPDSGGLIDGLARISAMNDGYSGKGIQVGSKNTAKELTDYYRSEYPELFDQAVAIFGEIDENGVFRRTMPYKFYRNPNIETDLPPRGEMKQIVLTDRRDGRAVHKAYYDDLLNGFSALSRNLNTVLEGIHKSRPEFRADLEGYDFPEDLKGALLQIYDSNLSREKAFAGTINKLPEAKEFNEVYRNTREARDEFFDIVRELGGVNVAGTGGKRGFGSSMMPAADARTSRLAARLDADEAYKAYRDALRNRQPGGDFLSTSAQELYDDAVRKLRLGPRPGSDYARLMPQEVDKKPYKYEEGGEVVSPDRALDLVADAINKTGRMPLFLKRALNPKTPMTESKETIRLAHDRIGDRFIVYPTLFPMNTPDGPRLTELGFEAARQKALDSGEYLIFDTEAEASTVAEGFSREIVVDNRPVQGGGVGDFIPYMVQ